MSLIQPHDIPSKTARFAPGQVNCLEKIKAGHVYWKVTENSQCTILAVSDPIKDDEYKYWIFRWIHWPIRQKALILKSSCSDYSIVPYSTGYWNQSNRLMTTNHRPLEKKELAKILEQVKN